MKACQVSNRGENRFAFSVLCHHLLKEFCGGGRCKGVDREDRIGVTVSNDGEVGREDRGFEASSVDHDAARLLAGSREAKQVAEGTVNLGRIWLDL